MFLAFYLKYTYNICFTFIPDSVFYIPPLNNGNWHQLCLSRKAVNESLEIFLDGFQGFSGKGKRNVARIFLGEGQLIIGQKKMLSGEGFDTLSSFKGLQLIK